MASTHAGHNEALDAPVLKSSRVSLALQGGAALGAYSWGVLDGLLEDGRLITEGVTGASAGALNAVAMAVGLSSGGPAEARELLRAFWEGLADRAAMSRRPRLDLARWLWRNAGRLRSAHAFFELTTRLAADYVIDPTTMEPLRSALENTLNYAVLHKPEAVRVFINATNINTAASRVFSNEEITTDVVCASAAVPLLVSPVLIDGAYYWDGALLGNPLVYPVIYGCTSTDIILIETGRAGKPGAPQTATDVISRTVALSSAVGLVRERRAIDFVTRLLEDAPHPQHRKIQLHVLPAHAALETRNDTRAFRADRSHFKELCDLGRERARAWLARLQIG